MTMNRQAKKNYVYGGFPRRNTTFVQTRNFFVDGFRRPFEELQKSLREK